MHNTSYNDSTGPLPTCEARSCCGKCASVRDSRVLIIGDSLMFGQSPFLPMNRSYIEHIHAYFTSNYSIQSTLQKYSGECFDFVYIDFAPLHMLHFLPTRPLVIHHNQSKGRADLIGGLYLEEIMRYHISLYQRIARNIIVMTPNRLCPGRFQNVEAYKTVRYAQVRCVKHVSTLSKSGDIKRAVDTHLGASIYGDTAVETNAQRYCEDTTFSLYGSWIMTLRMKRVVEQMQQESSVNAGIGLVDAFSLTERAGCNHSTDGVHYDVEVLEATASLAESEMRKLFCRNDNQHDSAMSRLRFRSSIGVRNHMDDVLRMSISALYAQFQRM